MSADVITLPTTPNLEAAWDDYMALANEFNDNPAVRVDVEFCKRMARAYGHWSRLLLASERFA